MMDVTSYVKQELARLRDENETLREEVEALRHTVDWMHTLLDTVDGCLPAGDPLPLLDCVLGTAEAATAAEESSLLIHDEEQRELVFVLVHGPVGEQLSGRRIPVGKGIAGWVVSTGQPTIVDNPYADDRFYAQIDEALSFRTRSILAAPLKGGGQVLGVIELLNKRDGVMFNETDQALLELMCRFAGQSLFLMMQQDQDDGGE